MSSSTRFHRKPSLWAATQLGSALLMAVMKLHPVQRALMKLEMKNIIDYFNDPKAPYPFQTPSPQSYSPLDLCRAGLMSYFGAIRRVYQLGRRARQDYFALNRCGCFSVKSIPRPEGPSGPVHPNAATPLIIIPGLNTPPVFFQEMHRYFTERGLPVSVLELPNNGLTDVATAATILHTEIERLKACYHTNQVNVVGHCLGGLIGHYYLSQRPDLAIDELPPIRSLITLSTGFLGSEGVRILKSVWMANHPKAVTPKVFDELIEWNRNVVKTVSHVAYHNFVTVWDFMVHFQKAVLKAEDAWLAGNSDEAASAITNHIINDCEVDHLTIALHPKMFQKIETALGA